MSDVRIVWKPIDRWPREQTANREWSPFRSKIDGYRRAEIGCGPMGRPMGLDRRRRGGEGSWSLTRTTT